MIVKLKGILEDILEGAVVLDVNQVGYLVHCSGHTLRQLPSQGEALSLLIETLIRPEHISLYGFINAEEREWFRLLMTVQGVGARVALALLTTLTPGDLLNAVMSEDKAFVSQAEGVGPKLASRLINELKDKVKKLPAKGIEKSLLKEGNPPSEPALISEALSALVNLGYRQAEALESVRTALKENPEASLKEVIPLALKKLSQHIKTY